MKITCLGFWGAYPFNGEGTTSYLVESDGFKLLLDAGSATLIALEEIIDPNTLDAVLISHYHPDHISDLGVLRHYRQLSKKTQPIPVLPIYGHGKDPFHFEELTMPKVSVGVAYSENEILDLGPFEITFMPTIHPVPCYAMRISEKRTKKVFVFTGDSGYMEQFIPFTKAADLFLADTYLLDGNENHIAHFTAGEAGRIALAADAKMLVLTHLPQDTDLELLKSQAEAGAEGRVPVLLAERFKVFNI